MLELLCDNRSGERLEIVIPTYNEEKRISNLLSYYGKDFDIVLMDGSSTDKTIELAIKSGATVFRRIVELPPGESYFVHYVNEVTKSGYCFYLFADEFIKKEDLLVAYEKLKSGNYIVMGRRIDWAYGICAKSSTCITPKGLCRGSAVYNPNELHASLEYNKLPGKELEEMIVDVHHLHIISMKHDYGKVGLYVYTEVQQALNTPRPYRSFIRQFVFRQVKSLFIMMRRFRHHKMSFSVWLITERFTVFLISILSLIEQKYLVDPAAQHEKYKIPLKKIPLELLDES